VWETIIWTFFAALIGLGTWAITLPPPYIFSRACFLLAALVLLGRLTWWLLVEADFKNGPMTFLLIFIIYAGVGIVLVSGFIWISNHERKTQETSKTGKQADKSEITQPIQRPLITLEAIKIIEPLVISERDTRIDLEITIKNDGPVPASHIMIYAQMVAVPEDGSMHSDVGINKALQFSKNREADRQHYGWLLAPTKTLSRHYVMIMRRDEIISAAKLSKDHNRVFIYIAGCNDYTFPAGEGQTTFNYILNQPNNKHLAFEISPRVVPIENLELLDGIYGVYAK
jgi:hypothetical protein